jgi:hypothetical protein
VVVDVFAIRTTRRQPPQCIIIETMLATTPENPISM